MRVIYPDGTTGELPDIPWLAITLPVGGAITQRFAVRSVTGIIHRGEDRAPGYGTPIQAVLGGVVRSTYTYGRDVPGLGSDGSPGGYGNQITIDHERTVQSHYAHLREGGVLVRAGDVVTQGQVIGYVGSTGISTGPHLHYELRYTDGTRFDPEPYYTRPAPIEEDELTDDEKAALAWLVANKGALSPLVLAAQRSGFTAANDTPARDDAVSKGIRRLAEFESDVLMAPLMTDPKDTADRLARALSRD